MKNWIDWMKVFGMLAIIWGHCFPHHFTSFLYSFSVPVFFLLSGYLTKTVPSNTVFWRKTARALIIPYLILSVLKALPHLASQHGWWSFTAILTGFHSLNDVPGCGKLWLVYTLILLKIIFQYGGSTFKVRALLFFTSSLGGYFYGRTQPDVAWAVANSLLAMPWFLIGYELKKRAMDEHLMKWLGRRTLAHSLLLSMLSAGLTYMIADFNGPVWMYQGQYGQYLVLFFLGGSLGSLTLVIMSQLLDKYAQTLSHLIAIGSIVILAFHQDVNHPLLKLVYQQHWSHWAEDAATLVCSIITLLVFIPITFLLARYAPLVIGMRK